MQTKKERPFLSIVIANFNYGSLLPSAIESIIHQDCDDYELIVVDGGSSDNSVDVIKKYNDYISWWVSEPDSGQSNAFNKGFAHAKGQFLTWLNADDILLPGTIKAVKKTLLSHPDADYATGNFIRFLNDTKIVSQASWGPSYLPKWMQGKGRFNPIYGPTAFWSRKSYDVIGGIDESLHYTMDVEYWARLTMNGYKQVRVNHYCWAFRMHDFSKTAEYGSHERDMNVKNIMRNELKYIEEKTGYRPTLFWRLIGYGMRIIDGSAVKMLYNRLFVKGRNVIYCFKIPHAI